VNAITPAQQFLYLCPSVLGKMNLGKVKFPKSNAVQSKHFLTSLKINDSSLNTAYSDFKSIRFL
jgi:hypothetical protein